MKPRRHYYVFDFVARVLNLDQRLHDVLPFVSNLDERLHDELLLGRGAGQHLVVGLPLQVAHATLQADVVQRLAERWQNQCICKFN